MISEWKAGSLSPCQNTFSFDVDDLPKGTLHFALTSTARLTSTASTALKRVRPTTDVDGEGSEYKQKKKRRLRLDLITSRLSQPYATPTTYIVGRGNIKLKRRPRRRYSGLGILRMAALINSTRIQYAHKNKGSPEDLFDYPIEDVEAYEEKLEMKNERKYSQRSSELNVQRISRSPLGLTDYDAIDREDPYGDDDDDDDDSNEEYSDSDESSIESDDGRGKYTQIPMPLPNRSETAPSLSRKPSLDEVNALVMEEEEQEEVSLALLSAGI